MNESISGVGGGSSQLLQTHRLVLQKQYQDHPIRGHTPPKKVIVDSIEPDPPADNDSDGEFFDNEIFLNGKDAQIKRFYRQNSSGSNHNVV